MQRWTAETRLPSSSGATSRVSAKQAKITKQKFALMVDVGRPFLNRIENGTADPRLSVILRLAEALETTPQELLTDPGEAPVQNAPKRHARLI